MFFKGIKQHDENDCAAACIATICKFYKRRIPLTIIRSHIKNTSQGSSAYGISKALEKLKLEATILSGNIEELSEGVESKDIKLPCIAHIVNTNNMPHFIVILAIKNCEIRYFDPALGNVKETLDDFDKKWTGIIISCMPEQEFYRIKSSKEAYYILFSFFKNMKKYIFITIVFSILISLISLIGAIAYKEIIDHFVLIGGEKHSHGNIVLTMNRVIITIFIFYIIQAVLGISRGFFLSKITEKTSYSLYNFFITKLLYLKNDFFYTRNSGEILSRYQKINETQIIFSRAFFTIILELITLLVSGYVLISISSYLFRIVLYMAVAYIIVTLFFIPFLNKIKRNQIEINANLITILNETLRGIELIKINMLEKISKKKYLEQANKMSNYTQKEIFLRSISSVMVLLTESVGLIMILLFGANLVIDNVITLGDLIAFETLVPFFILPLRNLVDSQSDIQSVYVNMEKLSDILEGEEETKESKELKIMKENDNILSVANISFSFDYTNDILNHISLYIKKGEKVAIVGGNGSGKTTLLKILSTLQEPDDGQVNFKNIDMYKNIGLVRENVSYVPQMSVIFSGTVKDNISFGKEELLQEEKKEFSNLKIFKYLNSFKYGLDTVITESGSNLSGGQKQIIGLCRGLVQNKEILLLDEATTNIEESMEEEFFLYLKQENKCKTVIAIIHNTKLEKYFDRVLVINNGYISEK